MGKELTTNAMWGDLAKKAAEENPTISTQWITTSGGILKLGDEELEGNRICVVVLDSVRENTYYPDAFDARDVVPPTCYAFGRTEEDMEPHEEMDKDDFFEPQHVDRDEILGCEGCPMNEWGSADKGSGKACQNRRRIAVLPAGAFTKVKKSRGEYELEIFDDPDHFEGADINLMKIPVTSVKDWGKFVDRVTSQYGRPPAGVFAEIWLEPRSGGGYFMKFDVIEEVPDELAEVIISRIETAEKALMTPYRPPRDDYDEPPAKARGLKGLRKGRR